MNRLSQNRKAIEAFSDLFAPTDVPAPEEKKACPNCGKMILADSLYCPFCEHDQSQPVPLSPEQEPGFHFIVLEVFASLVLIDLGLPALFLFLLQPFDEHEIVAAAAAALWLAFKVLLVRRVVEARSGPDGASFGKACGLTLMSFLPIGSWVAIGLVSARVASAKAARYIFPALALPLLLLDFGFAANQIPINRGQPLFSNLSTSQLSNSLILTPGSRQSSAGLSTNTVLPFSILGSGRKSATPLPTSIPGTSCRNVDDITLKDVGKTLCVRGIVRVGIGTNLNYYVSFGTAPYEFYMVGYGWSLTPGSGVDPGDCLQVTGKIGQVGTTPVMVVEPPDLKERCP
ncbi:MAG: hypothetical protein ABSG98_08060 [Anaerolineales bacterium]